MTPYTYRYMALVIYRKIADNHLSNIELAQNNLIFSVVIIYHKHL